MFVLGLPASVVEMQLGVHLTQSSSMTYTMKPKVSRGAGSHRRANVEKRVVSIKHHSYFAWWWSNDGNLQVVSLASQGSAVCLLSLECSIYRLAYYMLILVTQFAVSNCWELKGVKWNYIEKENSLRQFCICIGDAKSQVLQDSTRLVFIVALVEIVVV